MGRIIRTYTVLLFAVVVLVKAMAMPLICLDFKERRQAYAEACVNKMRPWMHCNGQCQLMKRLNRANENNTQNETNQYRAQFIDFCEPLPDYRMGPVTFSLVGPSLYGLPEDRFLPSGCKRYVLQPPRFA